MSQSIHNKNKEFINQFRAAMYDIDNIHELEGQLKEWFAPKAKIRLAFPFEDLVGPDGLFHDALMPLLTAVPDLERRDFIVMAGADADGRNWVGCGGHYTGVMKRPFLDIPPTRHMVAMRYHEFFCIEENEIVEMQALWDIPALMMQANAWPMTPSLGVEWPIIPGPASRDGIITAPYNEAQSAASLKFVEDMLIDMGKYPLSGGPEVMKMPHYWHPQMMWYGPAGIGSMRRVSGFRNWHQTPFLKAMPDRTGGRAATTKSHFFADGDYVGVTGWPNMSVTITGDGWLGIAPSNQKIGMRSLDFWRIENGLIRENWVLVDILSVYHQLGVNVFDRMREVTIARQG